MKWLREPFPGVSWGYLFRFIRLPLAWAVVVGGTYVALAVTVIDDRWSAAQVFLGIAGGGAALAALAGLAHEFQPERPELKLTVIPPGRGLNTSQQWTIYVTNDGRAPAYELFFVISCHTIDHEERMHLEFEQRDFWAPKEVALYNQGAHNWNHVMELAFARPVAPGVVDRKVSDVYWPGEHLTVQAWCENVRGAGPKWDSQVDEGGVPTA